MFIHSNVFSDLSGIELPDIDGQGHYLHYKHTNSYYPNNLRFYDQIWLN